MKCKNIRIVAMKRKNAFMFENVPVETEIFLHHFVILIYQVLLHCNSFLMNIAKLLNLELNKNPDGKNIIHSYVWMFLLKRNVYNSLAILA